MLLRFFQIREHDLQLVDDVLIEIGRFRFLLLNLIKVNGENAATKIWNHVELLEQRNHVAYTPQVLNPSVPDFRPEKGRKQEIENQHHEEINEGKRDRVEEKDEEQKGKE